MDTRFNISLIPYGNPKITYGVNEEINTLELQQPITLYFALDLNQGPHKFFIDFRNKTNSTPEMAIEIDNVSVEGITTDRMKWAGLYYPDYPEPWASEQTSPPMPVVKSSTFLGWNGRWELEFTVPIFRWVHQLEMLGWIYD